MTLEDRLDQIVTLLQEQNSLLANALATTTTSDDGPQEVDEFGDPVKSQASPAAPAKPPKTYTLEEVQEALKGALEKSKTGAKAAIESLGVKRTSELKPEQYADAIKTLKKVK